MANLSVNIAGVEWKNPVTTGSEHLALAENIANILIYRSLVQFVSKHFPQLLEWEISRPELPRLKRGF